MLGTATRIKHSLAAISVGDHSTELIFYKHICITALVVVLLFLQLLFQLLHCTGVASEILQLKLQTTHEALEGSVQQFTVSMKESKSTSTLQKAIAVSEPVMVDFQQKPNAYKFQIADSIVFHKAVDPAVITQPLVTLTSEMVAVCADDPPLNDVNRQLLNVIKVYEQNRSGWIF